MNKVFIVKYHYEAEDFERCMDSITGAYSTREKAEKALAEEKADVRGHETWITDDKVETDVPGFFEAYDPYGCDRVEISIEEQEIR